VKRILLTGISGVAKSTVTEQLAKRGYKAVDADSDAFSEWVEVSGDLEQAAGSPVESDRDWVWREDRIQELLSTDDTDMLFVSGCAANMGTFLPQFDHIFLLTAPVDVIAQRLQTRTNNPYGKHSDELARVLSLKESVEPLLRRVAGHEVDTNTNLDTVVEEILQHVQVQQ
jgi:shikimate kinase